MLSDPSFPALPQLYSESQDTTRLNGISQYSFGNWFLIRFSQWKTGGEKEEKSILSLIKRCHEPSYVILGVAWKAASFEWTQKK